MLKILILAEHSQGRLKPATTACAGLARELCSQSDGCFEILALGENLSAVATAASRLGASAVLTAEAPSLAEPIADRYAHVIAAVAREREVTLVVAGSSTFSKDILPRVAALLDAPMVSDAIGARMEADHVEFRRPIFAGNAIATVRLFGSVQVASVRATAFRAPPVAPQSSPVTSVMVDVAALPARATIVSREERKTQRPDPVEAQIVVSGGRGLKTREDFERLVGGLADVLGAAVGSSRALVDSGITPNSLQIGQTGKVVAPNLYLAVGISGAIQHLAGMKDAKVVAAINKDPDAPIFEVADYGLVADIYEVVPELIAKLKALRESAP